MLQKLAKFTPAALVDALSADPTRVGIEIASGQSWTRLEIAQNVSRYIQVLEDVDVAKGSKIAFLSNNSPELLFLTFAGQIAAACLVPLHALGSVSDHAFIITDAGIDALIFAPEFDQHVSEILALGVRPRVMFSLGQSICAKNLVKEAEGIEARSLTAPRIEGSDVCRLSYTGGTTGRPKGVMVPYSSFRHMLTVQLSEWEWPKQVRHLVCAPLSHAGASAVLPTLILGGTLILVPTFEAEAALAMIERFKITSTLVVPSMISAMLKCDRSETTDLSSLETIFYGGSSIAPAQLSLAIERFGPIFSQFYAQAEAPMVVSLLRKNEHDPREPHRLESCGRPLPGTEIRLIDPHGNDVEIGSPGELCISGPLIAAGYWKRPEETAETFSGGWLHTGDIAISDDHNFLRIVDRRKDMIVTGGFNVYSREVEDVLTAHPAVAAASVIGVPDEKWGEAVTAYVVLHADRPAVTPAELALHVRKLKGSVYAPKTVEIVHCIPLTSLGKPDKKLLRSRAVSRIT